MAKLLAELQAEMAAFYASQSQAGSANEFSLLRRDSDCW